MKIFCRILFFSYYTLNLSSESSPQAVRYNPILGPNSDESLKLLGRPKDWPVQIHDFKKPPFQISVYNDNADTVVREFSVMSEASGCYPDVKLEGCSTDAKRPTRYLPREYVKIRLVPLKRSAVCKNLIARLNKPVEFIERQNNEDLTFEQKGHFFQYDTLYTAVFGLEVTGSYLSVIGEDLVMNLKVMCFFQIDPPLSVVSVEGGSGTYDCSKPVKFRPVQTEPAFDTKLFTLRWSCVSLGASSHEPCQPVDTKWGIKTYTLECDVVYHFKLEPFHEYFKMTSPIKSNDGKPFEWTVETGWGASHIGIRCINSCFCINPQNEVDLEAVESPRTDTDLVWRLFEGNQTTPLPLPEYSRKLINKRAFSIKRGSLKPSSRYRVVAETSKGRGEIIFDTNSPPRNGTCSIVPTVGIKGNTEFTVGCQNWTDDQKPILYTVGVISDGLYVALVDSFYPDKIPPLVLYFNKVRVTIQDGFGMATTVDLKVVLLNLSDHSVVIHSKGDFGGLKNEAIFNSMIVSTYHTVNTEQKIATLRSIIELVPYSKTVNDLEGLLGSVQMVLEHHTNRYIMEDGVHELIELAGRILLVASDVLLTLGKTARRHMLGHSLIGNSIRALMSVANVLFQTRDPYLLDDSTATLDVQEVHRHKVKLGVTAALEALGVVLEVARAFMAPNFGPSRYVVGATVIFTSVGHAKTVQTQLDELGQTVATVRLPERTVALMGEDIYAVEVIVTDKEAYWWKPVSGQVLHTKFFKWHHRTETFRQIDMFLGPFDIPVKIDPELNYAAVQGVANRATEPCANQSKCQRLVTIHRIKLPPGQGAVSVEVDPVHFGQIKMIAIQDSIPTYSEIDSAKPVNRAKIDVKYNNDGIRLISNFYIAVISAKYDMYQYELYVQLGCCAYYVSEEWQSQGCQFKGIIKAKDGSYSAACQCSHLSTVGFRSLFPIPDLPNFDDLSLLFALKDHWIVVSVIGLIVVLYFLLLIYGVIKDKQDHQKEALRELPDNYPGDTYPYIIIIVTGMRCRAGTSSKVAFQLFGSLSRSRPHLFKGGQLKDTLNRGCDDWLLLFTRTELGDIEGMYVWHSNSGCSPDWYCSQITIYDVTNDKPYAFKVRRWFKIDPSNLEDSKQWRGEVDRVDWEVRETKPMRICGDRFILNLKDQHSWANIFLRHPRSIYNRCERIAALGSMIFTSMFFSIIYFGSGHFSASDVPGFSISLSDIPQIMASFLFGWIVGKVLSFLTLSLFSLSKQKLKKPLFGPPVVKKRCCGLFKTTQKPELFDHIPITTKEGLIARDAAKPSRLKCLRCLAWIVILISIFVFTFFIILYGLRFGVKRSLLWIQSVIFSLMLDAIIFGPGKMSFKAYTSSRRKGALTHDYFMEIDPETLWPAPMNYYERMERMWYRIRKEYKPFSYRQLLRLSKVRALRDFFYQYIVYSFFLGIMFFFILFFIRTFNTKVRYLANTALHHQLTEPRSPGVLNPKQIVTTEEFVEYVNKTLLVSLHRHKWYNGELLHFEPSEERVNLTNNTDLDAGHKGWCVGLLNKLHGVPRLRQQRVTAKPWKIININTSWWKWEWEVDIAGTVSPYFVKYFSVSLGALSDLNEDEETYRAGWKEYNPTTDANMTNLWTYSKTAKTLTGFEFGELLDFHGIKYVHYHGQGYVHLLYWSRAVSAQRFFEIINQGWIDNRTRVVFVEVNLYNVHLNFFTKLDVIAERAASGVFDVQVKVNSATLIAADPFRNTWMYMTYILIPLLLLFVIHYLQESSAHGVATIVSWQGLTNLAIIMIAFYVVKLNFDKATRFNVFSDTLNTVLRDQFDPLYVPFHTDQVTEAFSAGFGICVVAALASAVYRMLGYGNFKKMFEPVRTFMAATVVVNCLVNFRSAAAFRTLGIIDLDMGVVDTFFKSMPHAKLQRLSPKEQSIVILFIPFCFFFLKSLMGAIIFYYDYGIDEGPRKIGLAGMFVRRPTDPNLHKQLDKQDKLLEKKMEAVTKKLMQVCKKYKKKKGDEELYHARRKGEEDEDEAVPKGWLEAVWGSQAGHNLEDLEEERYKEVELPTDLKKGFQAQAYIPPELQAYEDKNKPVTDEPPPGQNVSMVLKPTTAEPKKLDEPKKSADENKRSEDKKKSVAIKPDDKRKKSEPTYIRGPKPGDEKKKSEVPTSADAKKSLVAKSADDKKKSIYKDAEDRKKSEVPKPLDEKKKSEVPKSDDKKSLVPKPGDDRKSVNKDAEDKKKAEASKGTGEKNKSDVAKSGDEKSLVPKPGDDRKSMYKDAEDRKKAEVPKPTDEQKKDVSKSDDKKSLVPKPGDDRKSMYKDAEDRKKAEVPKPTDEQKKDVSKSDDKKSLVPKPGDDRKSMYKDAEDRKKAEVPKPTDEQKKDVSKSDDKKSVVPKPADDRKSMYKDADDKRKSGVTKAQDDKGPATETPIESKKSKLSNLLKKMSNARKPKASDATMPSTPQKEGQARPGATSKEPELGVGKESGSGRPPETKLGLNVSGAASVGTKSGVGGPDGKPGTGAPPPSSAKPGGGAGKPTANVTRGKPDAGGPADSQTAKPGVGGLDGKPGTGAPQTPPSSAKPGGPGAGKPANVTRGKPDAGGPADSQTTAKPGAPPPRKPVYMGPGIQRPGISGTSPPERLPPAAGKSAPSPQEPSYGVSRTGPPQFGAKPTPPGPSTPGEESSEPRPRRPLDWVFDRAKRHAPPQPRTPPPPSSEPSVQSSKQQPQQPQKRPMGSKERSPKRPRPDEGGPVKDSPSGKPTGSQQPGKPLGGPQEPPRKPGDGGLPSQQTRAKPGAPPPRKPVYMGPGIPRPGMSGVSPPERLGTAPPGAPPPGSQDPRRPPGGPQEPRRPPGGAQGPGRPPERPQEPRAPPRPPLHWMFNRRRQ